MAKVIILGRFSTRIDRGVAKAIQGYTLEYKCLLCQGSLFERQLSEPKGDSHVHINDHTAMSTTNSH